MLVAGSAAIFHFSGRVDPVARPTAGVPAAPKARDPMSASLPSLAQPVGELPVPLADRVPAYLPAAGIPAGWSVKEFVGRASVDLVRHEGELAVRLRSESTSFALYRDAVVDLRELPVLRWSWMVTRLPSGGDVRNRERDDEAAQVYVVFPRWPSPVTRSDVIGYVWDSQAPVGTRLTSPKAANVKIVVLQSGAGKLGTWQHEQRNVLADYLQLFGHQPPRVGKVAVMIDTADTHGEGEALFGGLAFARLPTEDTKTPTPMLR